MLSLLVASLLATAGFVSAATKPFPLPENDPFYLPPAGFESSAPGTILKTRKALSAGIPLATANQLLFRTTDGNQKPIAVVATVLQKPLTSSRKQLAVYNDFEDAVNSSCAPSYFYNTDPNANFGPGWAVQALNRGFSVVVVDYEGLNSAYAVGHASGYAVLDGLRAALNYEPAGLDKDARIAGYGYSGGAIATGWAAALQPTYAPELNVVGWAFGGTPANVTSVLINVDGTTSAGYGFAGVSGLLAGYPQLQPTYAKYATDEGKAVIKLVRSQCAEANLDSLSGERFLSTKYQTAGFDLLYDPVVSSLLKKNNMGSNATETPTAPIYMYHGQSDEIIPYANARATAEQWCKRGSTIKFVTNVAGTGHVGTQATLFISAINFVADRLNGKKLAPGCEFTNSTLKGPGPGTST